MALNLTQKLTQAFRHLTGKSTLSENNIKEAIEEVRKALNEADVASPVVDHFIHEVKTKAIGQSVITSVQPAELFFKIVRDELIEALGSDAEACKLNLQTRPPAVILLVGLQGSGKTTTTVKLAHWIKKELHKDVMVASTDMQRAAAHQQLRDLAEQNDIPCILPESMDQPALTVAENALNTAKKKHADVLIIDTAGRLHIDENMMKEAVNIQKKTNPIETLFIVDSMMGQDALRTADSFSKWLELTGVILTKTESDTRGGSALSVKHVTGVPIKFIGTGEHAENLDYFTPERVANRLMDMGDMETLIRKVEDNIDQDKAKETASRIQKGAFDFNDFKSQLMQMRQMGGIQTILKMLPGAGSIPEAMKDAIDDEKFKQVEVMIDSMTAKERVFPELIMRVNSRKRRVCNGSGSKPNQLNDFLKQFKKMQKMMNKLKGGGMKKMMSMMSNTFKDG